jgi:hypothetical protein
MTRVPPWHGHGAILLSEVITDDTCAFDPLRELGTWHRCAADLQRISGQ